MGKTTLCKTIMGLVRATGGSVRLHGEEITRVCARRDRAPRRRLCAAGPPALALAHRRRTSAPGRRHRGAAPGRVERIYETFPRLAERKNNGGGQLSGGEQQMLAISRALLTNPQLLVMDEPTEGLAPVIVAQVEEMLVRLGDEGDIAVLVIEQNIGVATAVSEERRDHGQWPDQPHHRSAAAGRRSRICSSGCSGSAAIPTPSRRPIEAKRRRRDTARPAQRAARRSAADPHLRFQSGAPTRWSQPVPMARIEAAARTLSTGVRPAR